jgi:hypothetical protein
MKRTNITSHCASILSNIRKEIERMKNVYQLVTAVMITAKNISHYIVALRYTLALTTRLSKLTSGRSHNADAFLAS